MFWKKQKLDKEIENYVKTVYDVQQFIQQREDEVKKKLGNDVTFISQEGNLWVVISQQKQYSVTFETAKTEPVSFFITGTQVNPQKNK